MFCISLQLTSFMQTLFVISKSVSLSGSHPPLPLHIRHQDWTTFHHYSSPIHPPPAYTGTRNRHVLLRADVAKIMLIECCEVLFCFSFVFDLIPFFASSQMGLLMFCLVELLLLFHLLLFLPGAQVKRPVATSVNWSDILFVRLLGNQSKQQWSVSVGLAPIQRCYLSVCRTSAINHFNKVCLFGLLDMSVWMDAWEVGGDLQSMAGVSIGQQWINKYSMHLHFHIRSRNCQGC